MEPLGRNQEKKKTVGENDQTRRRAKKQNMPRSTLWDTKGLGG